MWISKVLKLFKQGEICIVNVIASKPFRPFGMQELHSLWRCPHEMQ